MKKSAGILLYKFSDETLLIFLVHPGGPFWKNKDLESWSIPKGEFSDDEEALAAAVREFEEETGTAVSGDFTALSPVKMKSGKIIYAFAIEGDIDIETIKSNDFEMEWPPKSGKLQKIPEVDRGEWFPVAVAIQKVNPAQVPLIIELQEIIGRR